MFGYGVWVICWRCSKIWCGMTFDWQQNSLLMSSYHFWANYSEKWNASCFALSYICLCPYFNFHATFLCKNKPENIIYLFWRSLFSSLTFCLENLLEVSCTLQNPTLLWLCINWNPFCIMMAGWATWCCAACFCQQARSSQCYECCWDHWQAWITLPAPATLVSNKWLSASVHLHLR